jgi:hypothetical protein
VLGYRHAGHSGDFDDRPGPESSGLGQRAADDTRVTVASYAATEDLESGYGGCENEIPF